MKICEKCAHCNDDEVKFCVMCGKPLIKKETPVSQMQMLKPQLPIEKQIKTGIPEQPKHQEIRGVESSRSERPRKGVHPLFYIVLLVPIAFCVLWPLAQGALNKECEIISKSNLNLSEYGEDISFVVRTDEDWLKRDMINVVADPYVEWQHNDGKYYEKYVHVKLSEDEDFLDHWLDLEPDFRFENDSTIVIHMDRNRGYNRKLYIFISVRGEHGLESIWQDERFIIYQEGIMGKGDFEVMP